MHPRSSSLFAESVGGKHYLQQRKIKEGHSQGARQDAPKGAGGVIHCPCEVAAHWKKANNTTILKMGNKKNPGNYRLASLT